MNVLMLCPHVRISGGVKVLFRLAEGLVKQGINVRLAVNKYKHKNLLWYPHKKLPFKITEMRGLVDSDYNKYDCVINYGDGPPLTNISTKKVLFLQGLASQNKAAEIINLKNKYDMIITTSKWLHDVAKEIGHPNVQIVPPGIDSIFKPLNFEKNRVPVIGALFHRSPDKQFNLFLNTIHALFTKHKKLVHSMIFSASLIKEVKILDKWILPYTLVVNPPQEIIPSVYSACDAWFATSKNEGFGLPPLEAMACKVPVLWYPNLGLHGHINESNCMVVRNHTEAAEAAKSILENPNVRNRLIENGTKLAAKFTWDNSIKQFADCLRSLQ